MARGRILGVKLGYNPNSSSLSMDVTFLMLGMLVLSLLVPLVSLVVRLTRRVKGESSSGGPGDGSGGGSGAGGGAGGGAPGGSDGSGGSGGSTGPDVAAPGAAASARTFRAEAFGGVVALDRPRALVLVDRDYARALGHPESPRWQGAAPAPGARPFAAPLEAHLTLTSRCPGGCAGCYVDATPAGAGADLAPDDWRRGLDALAAMGVFHVALGGGESALLPWLPAVARHARARGLVPNLTTSGLGVDALLDHARLFGQINVSVDGVGATYARVRGHDGFARADAAVQALRARTRHVGLNVVVTRDSFADLERVFAYARLRRVRDLELLRFKPAGRGGRDFARRTLTDEQHRALLPAVLGFARRHRVRVRLDCSLVPMIAWHRPEPRLLAALAVMGCAGGDALVGVRPDGRVSACSFAAPPPDGPRLAGLAAYWERADAFAPFRDRAPAAEPCRSCRWQPLCRGGCRAVAAHLEGDPALPDPECPFVVAWRREHAPRLVDLGAA